MTSLAKCFGWSQICWSGERVQNYIVFFLWFVELNAKNTHILDHIILQWLAVCLAQMPLSTSLPLSHSPKKSKAKILKNTPQAQEAALFRKPKISSFLFFMWLPFVSTSQSCSGYTRTLWEEITASERPLPRTNLLFTTTWAEGERYHKVSDTVALLQHQFDD